MGASMQGACAGLRVLDLTQGMAGPLATMILADFGAEVVRVEPPEGDPLWSDAAYLLVQTGEAERLELDSRTDAGRQELADLAAGVDVIVESIGAEAARRAGIGYDELSATQPAAGLLLHQRLRFLGSVRAGQGGRRSGHGEGRASSATSRDGSVTVGDPVYRAPRDGSYFAAMLAVQGILAAVMARDLTGKGQLVETNLLQALACRQNPEGAVVAARW